jgi:colanic acid biosynthesis glycosyl transferase WcaI
LTRVVVLNRFFFPDRSATGRLATDLAVHLAGLGFDVVAITGRRRYDDPSAHLGHHGAHAAQRIRRLGTTQFGRQNLFGRAVDYLSYYVCSSFALWREAGRGAVIIAMTDPPLLGVPALFVARLRSAHYVNWLQDVYPEAAERLNLLRPRALASFLRTLRNWSLRRADATVVIGEQMGVHMAPFCAAPPVVIPNWAQVECLEAIDSNLSGDAIATLKLRDKWGLPDAFLVGYSGNMGRAHRLDVVIDAACALRAQPALHFLMIGEGVQRTALEARARSLGLQNVTFQPYQPFEQLRESLTVPDIHIVTLDERLEGLMVPSKFVGVLAMGRPVLWIGAADGEVGRLVQESGCGVTVAPGDAIELARALRGLIDDRAHGGERLRSMAIAAKALWSDRFRRRNALAAWTGVIERCAREIR